MGGCRCTYKNCTLRTDGVTHMFHYPVFDKVRCHQWLTNAQKLEFLNLKVSQLKNRVVCQHHFKDDNFMNFLKDKLTFDAVPTEDGPYCDTSQLAEKKPVQEDSKLYSISLEDIENEYLTFNDKKANFSVKYGDFLTNCELMDLDSMNLTNDSTQIVAKNKGLEDNTSFMLNNRKKVTINPTLNKPTDMLQLSMDNVFTLQMNEVPAEVVTARASEPTDQGYNILISTHKPKELPKRRNGRSFLKDNKKITILEEQKISQPLPVTFPIKLEPIRSSAVLPLPNKRRNLNSSLGSTSINQDNSTKLIISDIMENNNVLKQPVSVGKKISNIGSDNVPKDIEIKMNCATGNIENIETNVQVVDISPPKPRNNVVNSGNIKQSKNSILKSKIPPERMAAIEEKRKFNMKLRDIVASCLDKLDDKEVKDYGSSKLKSNLEKNITQKVSSYLAKEPQLPGIHDYTVAYLEARMKKMESVLLNKIDQNSQRILELKQSFTSSPDKKAAYTQTAANEEQQKKHLYQEISKYLSPEANSLLYEELFINKYAQKVPQCSPTRKRKRR